MTIIMRKSGQKRDGGDDKKKQLYTWSGCGLVVILTLVMVLPNVGKQQQPDYSKFSSSRMQDLAALPFGTDDEAADFLRGNPEYKDVSNTDLLGSLFSAEDRKARHEQDELNGAPPPPDPEYREIYEEKLKEEKAKEIVQERSERRTREVEQYNKAKADRAEKVKKKKEERLASARKSKEQNPTKVGSLQRGPSSSGGGSASTSVVGSIWASSDKKTNSTPGTAPSKHDLTAKDLAFAKDKGKGMGFYQAAVESQKAAKADTAEGRLGGMMDAFSGNVDAKDLEKDKDELGLKEDEDITDLIDTAEKDDLTNAISDDVNEQTSNAEEDALNNSEYSIDANCIDSNGKWVSACFWSNLGTQLITSTVNGLVNCVTSGCWNNWGNKNNYLNDIKLDGNGNAWIYDHQSKSWNFSPGAGGNGGSGGH